MASAQSLPPEVARQNKGPAIIATTCTFTIVATMFVAARLFVRSRIIQKLGLDDYLVLLSMVFGYLTLGLSIAAVQAGNGRHADTLSLDEKSQTVLFTFASFCPGILSFAVPKLAVVALLTKVLNPSRAHKMFLWGMTSGALLVLLGCVIILYAQCTPSRAQWDFSIKNKTCWNPWILVYYSMTAGTISAVVDLYLAVYPALVLLKLQMRWKKKLALSIALGIGSVAAVVAIYKVTRLPGLASEDFSYETADLVIWTSMEGNTIIIAACIPTLQPLLELILGRKALGSTSEGHSNRYYNRYGSRSGHIKTGSIELEASSSSANMWSRSRSTKDTADVDSQESILRDDAVGMGVIGSGDSKESGRGIRKTRDVVVRYGADTGEQGDLGNGWRDFENRNHERG